MFVYGNTIIDICYETNRLDVSVTKSTVRTGYNFIFIMGSAFILNKVDFEHHKVTVTHT